MSVLTEVKQRQQKTWSAGDYGLVAGIVSPLGDVLCEAIDLKPGSSVLDVACGTGNAALAAARRFCNVTGIDYVPALLEQARRRPAFWRVRAERNVGRQLSRLLVRQRTRMYELAAGKVVEFLRD